MTTTITAQDGTGDSTTPKVLDGFNGEAESGNIVHTLIAPGQIAVTVLGDLPRSGTLRLVYDDDSAAEASRELLGRATSFVLSEPERAALGMTFVRQGRCSAVLHDTIRQVWLFDVGYQEIVP